MATFVAFKAPILGTGEATEYLGTLGTAVPSAGGVTPATSQSAVVNKELNNALHVVGKHGTDSSPC
jgi:hypothetical protein